MAKRKIVWTERAEWERKDILEYWINRNKSKTFSLKLNKIIREEIVNLAINPEIGRLTEVKNVRLQIIRDYLLFYQISGNKIFILSIWDSRRNPKSFNL